MSWCLQLVSAAAVRVQPRSIKQKAVPTYIGEAYFKSPQGTITVKALGDTLPSGSIVGECTGVDETKSVVLVLKDVKLTPVDDGDVPPEDPHAGGRVQWRLDIDFLDPNRLVDSKKKIRPTYYKLQKLVLLCCIAARDNLATVEAETAKPYLAKFRTWVFGQVAEAQRDGYALLNSTEIRELFGLSPDERSIRMKDYLQLVEATEYATIGKVV
jgi:hypothetical protein